MGWLLKRWWFWTGTGFILVAVVAGYLLIPAPVEKQLISQETCDKIQLGWTIGQVEHLLEAHGVHTEPGRREDITHYWGNEDGLIQTHFDNDFGTVTEKTFTPSSLSFAERMKRRIERRLRAIWP
jgi:hypothetical protein